MITRESAYKLVLEKISNKTLIKHMLATEAVMALVAEKFGEDKDLWGLAGLVHDIDYTETEKTPEKHALVGSKWLEELGYPKEICYAVSCHNSMTGVKRISKMDETLYTCDPLTGLIVACALIHKDKKLEPIDVPFVLNRFREKRFAAGANREQIENCSNIGLTLEEFIDIGLEAMKGISKELGL
ncbi:MAG: HDIG domain-containing protein [Caldisericia bacterium]